MHKVNHQDEALKTLCLQRALADPTLPCQGWFMASKNTKQLPHTAALIKKLCVGSIDGHPGMCKVSDCTT